MVVVCCVGLSVGDKRPLLTDATSSWLLLIVGLVPEVVGVCLQLFDGVGLIASRFEWGYEFK